MVFVDRKEGCLKSGLLIIKEWIIGALRPAGEQAERNEIKCLGKGV